MISDVKPGDQRLQELLASAAVLAFPSTADTFGYAVLEAMAVRTPVVAARMAAMPEIVTHGRTGLLVEPDDAEALADGLESVLADEGRGRQLGEAARTAVLERFDARRTTEQVVALLHEVADGDGR